MCGKEGGPQLEDLAKKMKSTLFKSTLDAITNLK